MTGSFPALFSRQRIGPREAKNRIWLTGHGTAFFRGPDARRVSLDYYLERARADVGVITIPFEPRLIPEYPELSARLHELDCLVLQQTRHMGKQRDTTYTRDALWAPSAIPDLVFRRTPHEMTAADIDAFYDEQVEQSCAAADGGLDGIEIHAAHGYLVNEFLSAATNHRTDSFGGSLENRSRLLFETCARVRAAVPSSTIVGVRINGSDGTLAGSVSNAEWVEIATELGRLKLVDYLSVSTGTYWHRDRLSIYASALFEPGHQVADAARIKAVLPDVPVVAVGRILSPTQAEGILANGQADFIGLTRALVADPEWAAKAKEGTEDEIRPCVGLNMCIASTGFVPMMCVHNPAVGRERELGAGTLIPTSSPRRVAVVGAGPAGMRAALTAAQRGHDVTLYEASGELGGRVRLMAASGPYQEAIGVVSWLENQLAKTSAQVLRNSAVTADDLAHDGYHSVIVATGAKPIRHGFSPLRPEKWVPGRAVPGIGQDNVLTVDDLLAAPLDRARVSSAIIFDCVGDRQAVIAADRLVAGGARVEIVTPMPLVARDLEISRELIATYERLRQAGVRFTPNCELASVDGTQAEFADIYTGATLVREGADLVVLSIGHIGDDALLRGLSAQGIAAHGIGDCVAPRGIFEAIWDGELEARAL